MQKNMDQIQFESRNEIRKVAAALKYYIENHPKEDCSDLKRLYALLDAMDMEW